MDYPTAKVMIADGRATDVRTEITAVRTEVDALRAVVAAEPVPVGPVVPEIAAPHARRSRRGESR
jgi:hypothetical protein